MGNLKAEFCVCLYVCMRAAVHVCMRAALRVGAAEQCMCVCASERESLLQFVYDSVL